MVRGNSVCNAVAKVLVDTTLEYTGWDVFSSSLDDFVPGNTYTAGCFWNNGGANLWMNPYGVESVCTGPQDCRTLCEPKGIPVNT